VDGLRAIAIIPVILYHINTKFCPGGYTGVDVFFVISGYLITGGIITKLYLNQFSLSNFYSRRIKRIIPNYFLTIICVLFASTFILNVSSIKTLCNTSIYALFNITNIFFVKMYNILILIQRIIRTCIYGLWQLKSNSIYLYPCYC